jgi:hypothetical protein
MGRLLRRVPVGFNWPLDVTWWGFELDPVPCGTCGGHGTVMYNLEAHGDAKENEWCPTCGGEGDVRPEIDPPTGDAWQYWETTSDGSAITPPFETLPDLAGWMVDNGASGRPYRETLEYLMSCGDRT